MTEATVAAAAERQASELVALRERVRDLEACLGLNDHHLGNVFKLSPALMKLLGLLLNVQNVTPEMIQSRLRIATDAKVAVHRLRQDLDRWCAATNQDKFVIHSKRSLGYWFDEATKSRIRCLTTGVTIAPAPEPELAEV